MDKEDDLLSTDRCLRLDQVCLTNLWAITMMRMAVIGQCSDDKNYQVTII